MRRREGLRAARRLAAPQGITPPSPTSARRGAADANRDPLIVGFEITDAEIADLVAFLESLTDEAFLTNPAHADPWPDGHPATAGRLMPPPLAADSAAAPPRGPTPGRSPWVALAVAAVLLTTVAGVRLSPPADPTGAG